MTKQLLKLMAFCAAALVAAAQAQTVGSQGTTTGTQDTSGSESSSDSSKHLSATGRSSHQEVRATKLIGSDVKSSSGEELGTINDVILNPASGRIDFAVISCSSTSGATGSSSASGTTGTTGTSTTRPNFSSISPAGTGKLVAVPWSLLRPSGASGYGATTSGTQQTFVFSGDSSKLQGAPSFEQSNWPDISQPSWRQSIYSYFGTSGATGGANTPGGRDSSSGSSTSPSTPPSSTPPDSGKP